MKKNKDYMFQTKIDSRTDFEKGIYYKTCEGKDGATMEEVMQYNQMFYESMMIKKERKPSENKDDMSR